MKVNLNTEKAFLISNLINRLLTSYDQSGHTVENYYNNIILPDLDEEGYKLLHEVAEGNFK